MQLFFNELNFNVNRLFLFFIVVPIALKFKLVYLSSQGSKKNINLTYVFISISIVGAYKFYICEIQFNTKFFSI